LFHRKKDTMQVSS